MGGGTGKYLHKAQEKFFREVKVLDIQNCMR